MYGQLIEQAEKYLRSLYQQDDTVAQLKRKLADLLARGEANADAAGRALRPPGARSDSADARCSDACRPKRPAFSGSSRKYVRSLRSGTCGKPA
jgi:hypothetical protein